VGDSRVTPHLSDPARLEEFARTDELLRHEFGLGARPIRRRLASRARTVAQTRRRRRLVYAEDAHLKPDRLLAEWQRVQEGLGVVMRPNCKAVGFRTEGRKAEAW